MAEPWWEHYTVHRGHDCLSKGWVSERLRPECSTHTCGLFAFPRSFPKRPALINSSKKFGMSRSVTTNAITCTSTTRAREMAREGAGCVRCSHEYRVQCTTQAESTQPELVCLPPARTNTTEQLG